MAATVWQTKCPLIRQNECENGKYITCVCSTGASCALCLYRIECQKMLSEDACHVCVVNLNRAPVQLFCTKELHVSTYVHSVAQNEVLRALYISSGFQQFL